MGRTGKMFASDHFDFKAGYRLHRQGIGSGLPIGVCVARADFDGLEARRSCFDIWR